MQVVQAEIEGHVARLFSDGRVRFFPHLHHDLFDARRVNAAVRNQPLNRHLGDLATVRVKARQNDCARRVVHDEIDAGCQLEGANVAAFAPDDAAFR